MSWSEAKAIHATEQQFKEIEKNRERIGLTETARKMGLTGDMLEAATRRQEIDDQWFDVAPFSKRMHIGERKMLYDILDSSESVKSLVGGTFRADTNRLHKHNGVAIATDKRVVFLDKGILGSTEVQEMPYRNVEAITYSTGMLMAGVQITGRGISSFRIEDIRQKDSVRPFVDCVRSHVDAVAITDNPSMDKSQQAIDWTPAVSVADEIEKFGQLVEKGILTPEEFAAKKQQLLGI